MLKLAGLVLIPDGAGVEAAGPGDLADVSRSLMVGAFLAGLRWKYVAVIAVVTVLVLPVSWHFLKDYQKARLVSFMDPERDPQGTGYQLIQSQIAVGAGGMFGKGVTKGTQTQLRFLPVPHKDFIFSAFAEEHGFVGVVVVLALYFVMIMRIVQNAQTAPDRAGMYICMGVAALLLFHILVNVGMVAGLMPVTGIPLPFMSAGGSSIWSSFLASGAGEQRPPQKVCELAGPARRSRKDYREPVETLGTVARKARIPREEEWFPAGWCMRRCMLHLRPA